MISRLIHLKKYVREFYVESDKTCETSDFLRLDIQTGIIITLTL